MQFFISFTPVTEVTSMTLASLNRCVHKKEYSNACRRKRAFFNQSRLYALNFYNPINQIQRLDFSEHNKKLLPGLAPIQFLIYMQTPIAEKNLKQNYENTSQNTFISILFRFFWFFSPVHQEVTLNGNSDNIFCLKRALHLTFLHLKISVNAN